MSKINYGNELYMPIQFYCQSIFIFKPEEFGSGYSIGVISIARFLYLNCLLMFSLEFLYLPKFRSYLHSVLGLDLCHPVKMSW